MNYKITDIRNFLETASCNTISEASRKLEISQPALSESIKNLEGDLGCILFYRSRTGIQLTSSGKQFLDKAKKAFLAFEDLDMKTKEGAVFSGQSISIGCHAMIASYFVPGALKYLRTQAPDYKINLVHDLSRNIQSEVQKGNIDIGIVVNAVEVPDLIINKVSQDTVGIWTSKSAFDDDTVICNLNFFQTQSILKKWKQKPTKIISTDSLDLICRLTAEGIGYGIIPEKAVAISGFKLKNLDTLPSYKDEFSLVYRPEFGKTKAEKLTIEALKKAIT
jgi:DNA-binding transcriptional LysR family regulator